MTEVERLIRESVTEKWVKLERASENPWGDKILTFVIKMPKFLVAQFNTHSMVRRNSASTRAIPTATQTKRIDSDMFIPPVWTLNKKGMAGTEILSPELSMYLNSELTRYYTDVHEPFYTSLSEKYKIHKQHLGRYSEPFMWTEVCATANEEWFQDVVRQRDNEHAQPEFQIIGHHLGIILSSGVKYDLLSKDEWHTPFLTAEETQILRQSPKENGTGDFTSWEGTKSYWCAISAARSARVSYLNQYGTRDLKADVELYTRLLTDGHLSPLEHVVRPIDMLENDIYFKSGEGLFCGPYKGFRSLRSIVLRGE